jgi:hypothetical protein
MSLLFSEGVAAEATHLALSRQCLPALAEAAAAAADRTDSLLLT